MNLLELDHKHLLDVFMDNQLGESVFPGPVGVAQRDLLVVVLVKRNRGTIEKLDKVLELHPEDSIEFIVDSKFLRKQLPVLLVFLFPVKLPLPFRPRAVRVSNLDKTDGLAFKVHNSHRCEQSVGVMIS